MSKPAPTLVLASASPRRRELLAQAGYTFTVQVAGIDESRLPGESPFAYVLRLAREKALAVLALHTHTHPPPTGQAQPGHQPPTHPAQSTAAPCLLVLGADTTVVLDGHTLGKPATPAEARAMLTRLAGRAHSVLTGIAVASSAGVLVAVETTIVHVSPIPPAELDLYCASAEPLDKAGAYGIQGYAARWIPRIEGCYFNVMGLPIARTVRLLNQAAQAHTS